MSLTAAHTDTSLLPETFSIEFRRRKGPEAEILFNALLEKSIYTLQSFWTQVIARYLSCKQNI